VSSRPELSHDALPFRVLRLGSRLLRVPAADIVTALGCTQEELAHRLGLSELPLTLSVKQVARAMQCSTDVLYEAIAREDRP
jgi:hypothetical protein